MCSCRPQAELEDLPVDDNLDRTIESWDIADALPSLRPEHRQVLTEMYFRGCSSAQAAVSLGIPVGTVKSRAFHGLKALKAALQEWGITR